MVFDPTKILREARERAPIIMIYGRNGSGKTSFVASTRGVGSGVPLVLDAENKCNQFDGMDKYVPGSYADVLGFLGYYREIAKMEHSCICVDSLDWVEARATKHLLNTTFKGKESLAKVEYGVGTATLRQIMRDEVLESLKYIRAKHNIPIIITAQEGVVTTKKSDEYTVDTIDLRCNKGVREDWSDMMDAKLYMRKEGNMVESPRVLVTTNLNYRTKMIVAKNSLGLPKEVTISYNSGYQDLLDAMPKN